MPQVDRFAQNNQMLGANPSDMNQARPTTGINPFNVNPAGPMPGVNSFNANQVGPMPGINPSNMKQAGPMLRINPFVSQNYNRNQQNPMNGGINNINNYIFFNRITIL